MTSFNTVCLSTCIRTHNPEPALLRQLLSAEHEANVQRRRISAMQRWKMKLIEYFYDFLRRSRWTVSEVGEPRTTLKCSVVICSPAPVHYKVLMYFILLSEPCFTHSAVLSVGSTTSGAIAKINSLCKVQENIMFCVKRRMLPMALTYITYVLFAT